MGSKRLSLLRGVKQSLRRKGAGLPVVKGLLRTSQ